MRTTLKSVFFACLLAAGGNTVLPEASRADAYLGLGGGSGPVLEFRFGDDGRSHRRHYRDRDRYERDRYEHRAACSPDHALRKAERMGLRRPRVIDVTRRTVVVQGRDRGDRVTVVFGRARGCPVIGY